MTFDETFQNPSSPQKHHAKKQPCPPNSVHLMLSVEQINCLLSLLITFFSTCKSYFNIFRFNILINCSMVFDISHRIQSKIPWHELGMQQWCPVQNTLLSFSELQVQELCPCLKGLAAEQVNPPRWSPWGKEKVQMSGWAKQHFPETGKT